MKKLIPIQLSLIIMLLHSGCNHEVKVPNNQIIISGKIDNLNDTDIKVMRYFELTKSEIDSDGNFKIQFEYDEPDYFMLIAGRYNFEFFLEPGDSIHLNVDVENTKETFRLSGDKTVENTYLRKRILTYHNCGIRNISEIFKLKKTQYYAKIDSLKLVLSPLIEELGVLKEVNPLFKELESKFFEYEFLKLDYNYPRYHAHFNSISQDAIDFPFEQVKKAVLDLPMDNSNYVKIDSYRELLRTLHMDVTYELTNKFNLDFQDATWKAADSIFRNDSIKAFMRYQDLEIELSSNPPFNYQDYIKNYMNSNPPAKFIDRLTGLTSTWNHLKPGSEVPDFEFEDVNGNVVRVKDFEGKLVYIDLWATWCAPCIAEHPYLNAIVDEYKDQPIVFVNISLDSSRDLWEKMVKDKNMTGYQWIAMGAFKSELAKHFLVRGIPRFLLLDQSGKVISPAAPRPSGSLRETLNEYLQRLDSIN